MILSIHKLGIAGLLVITGCLNSVFGQSHSGPAAIEPPARPKAAVTAPTPPSQVLTVIRRMSGPRLLSALRQSGAPITAVDQKLLATRLATTNICAGLILGDDDLVAVWAPSLQVELDAGLMPPTPPAPPVPAWTTPQPQPAAPKPAPVPLATAAPSVPLPARFNDVTLVTADGRQINAQYVGVDWVSGVTLFRARGLKPVITSDVEEKEIQPGLRVFLLFPRGAVESQVDPASRVVTAQLAKREGRVVDVVRGEGGRVTSATLSLPAVGPELVGGVAVTSTGQTVGIVHSVRGQNVRLIPPRQVKSAASRLSAPVAMPRPWLGVRGEPFNSRWFARLEEFGWDKSIAWQVAEKQKGILLTSVVPGTPAEGATLKPGDLVVRLNGVEFGSKEEFSILLNDISVTQPLNLTVLKRNQLDPIVVSLKLKTAIDPVMSTLYAERMTRDGGLSGPLESYGIDTLPISAKAAASWQSKGGLLVLGVQPDSAASKTGLQVQDIIETVDNKPAEGLERPLMSRTFRALKLGVVRNLVKIELELKPD